MSGSVVAHKSRLATLNPWQLHFSSFNFIFSFFKKSGDKSGGLIVGGAVGGGVEVIGGVVGYGDGGGGGGPFLNDLGGGGGPFLNGLGGDLGNGGLGVDARDNLEPPRMEAKRLLRDENARGGGDCL